MHQRLNPWIRIVKKKNAFVCVHENVFNAFGKQWFWLRAALDGGQVKGGYEGYRRPQEATGGPGRPRENVVISFGKQMILAAGRT